MITDQDEGAEKKKKKKTTVKSYPETREEKCKRREQIGLKSQRL